MGQLEALLASYSSTSWTDCGKFGKGGKIYCCKYAAGACTNPYCEGVHMHAPEFPQGYEAHAHAKLKPTVEAIAAGEKGDAPNKRQRTGGKKE